MSKEYKQIFGGFTDIPWYKVVRENDQPIQKGNHNSFLFKQINNERIEIFEHQITEEVETF